MDAPTRSLVGQLSDGGLAEIGGPVGIDEKSAGSAAQADAEAAPGILGHALGARCRQGWLGCRSGHGLLGKMFKK